MLISVKTSESNVANARPPVVTVKQLNTKALSKRPAISTVSRATKQPRLKPSDPDGTFSVYEQIGRELKPVFLTTNGSRYYRTISNRKIYL
jgi:hypothetical protein